MVVLALVGCGEVSSDPDPDAPARVCAAGQTATCRQDTLVTCDADGAETSTQACALGCDATGTARCKRVDPSNGLAQALDDSEQAPELSLMGATTIDTDAGTITDQSGARTPPTTTLQSGPVDVFVIQARTFTAPAAVRVVGKNALAIVAFGEVRIGGGLAADAASGTNGAGALATDLGCRGNSAAAGNANGQAGGGGGGFGTKGGNGGSGGSPVVVGATGGGTSGTLELVPLRGGCPGGRASNKSANYAAGGGGGAIQVVSNTSITIGDGGFISVNGAGGSGPTGPLACLANTPCGNGEGGGSGGAILLEAPVIDVATGGGLAANGGAGSCSVFGSSQSGQRSATPAAAQTCGGDTGAGGNGAAAAIAALNGAAGSGDDPVGGGGGGGAGRIRVNLPLGATFTPAGVVSPAASLGTLRAR